MLLAALAAFRERGSCSQTGEVERLVERADKDVLAGPPALPTIMGTCESKVDEERDARTEEPVLDTSLLQALEL